LFLAQLGLVIAAIGIVSCTVFLTFVAISALRFRRRCKAPQHDSGTPFVSLLKPLCGLEPRLEENLTSFFQQDYPNFEIVFGTRDGSDPALNVVRTVQARFPHVPVKIAFSGQPDRPNAKVCSLIKMCKQADAEYLIISDSDAHVSPGYLREVVRPLLNPKVGLVTCIYRGVPTGGFWSRLEALGMSVEMTAGVLAADLLEGMKFALGPTMAIRRNVLDAIGGMEILADYCADDYVLGNRVHEAGYEVVLSQYVVDHIVLNYSFRSSMLHQVRWMKSTRFSRPKGHLGTIFTFAMPFGLLGLASGFLAGHALLGVSLFVAAVVNRVLLSLLAGWTVVRDPQSLKYCWLYPVRDLLGFFLWCASFTSGQIVWREQVYRLETGGKMLCLSAARTSTPSSAPVAVDDLAGAFANDESRSTK